MAPTLGVIGCGKMAYAILAGLRKKASITIKQLLVNDIDETYSGQFAQEFKGTKMEQNRLVEQSDIIILAVKPHQIESVLKANSDCFRAGQLIVSVAAGISTSLIEETLSAKCAVVRAMPNTPALIGEGVTALTSGKYATEKDINLVKELFDNIGQTYLVEEKNMDAITAVSGSGPAYVYFIVEALINAGVSIGLDNSLAKNLVLDTVKGSINMIEKSGKHPAQLRDEVCSPAGTTIAAIKSFEEKGLRSAIFAGVEKAFLRSQELGQK